MADKLVTCKTCGAEMSSSAKACPKCGAKNKKPIYKKWWFYGLIVLVLVVALSSGNSDSPAPSTPAAGSSSGAVSAGAVSSEPEPTEPEITYTHYNVTELFDALNDNALNAKQTFLDQYVEIEGYLGTIDSDGQYIGVGAASSNYDYFLSSVHCTIMNDEQLQQIAAMKVDSPITVRGKITDVGEVLGYYLDIDSIG